MNSISAKKLRGHWEARCMECGWTVSSIPDPTHPRNSTKSRITYLSCQHYESHGRMQNVFVDGHLAFSPVYRERASA